MKTMLGYYSVIHFVVTLVSFSSMIVPAHFSKHSNDEKIDWVGKAYIITSKVQIPDDVASAAKACGFVPRIVTATLPFGSHYSYSREKMYKACLAIKGRKLLPYGESTHAASTTVSELALICSHRNAMHLIAEDLTMSDSDWALIMEDDAVLNKALNPALARLYSTQAINFARWESNDEGFIYFGICGGVCSNTVATFLAEDQFIVGKSCFGYCSHAYALTKYTSRTLFANIYNNEILKGNPLQTDQAMAAYFQANLKKGSQPLALVAGHNFQSPDESTHTGLMYQINRSKSIDGGFSLGTTLTTNKFRHQTCFIMRGDGTTVTVLLVQYAALVSFCLRRNLLPQYCASFVSAGNKKATTFNLFTQEFRIDTIKCVANNQTFRDVDIVDRINSERKYSPSNFISVAAFGTTFQGSFGNLIMIHETTRWLKRYFQSVFKPSPYIRSSSSSSVEGKEYPTTTILGWLTESLDLDVPQQVINLTPCSLTAVDVCIHISGATKETESEQALLQKFYASALNRLSSKYFNGIALRLILDSSVRMAHLQGILSLPSQYNAHNASCIYVKSLNKFNFGTTSNFQADLFNMHQDIWTIRALIGCNTIVFGHSSLVSWWGAYLSSAEVIISSQVQNPSPGWTVI